MFAAIVFYFFGPEDAGGEFLFFLLGIAALYVVLQIYAHIWSRQDEKKLDEAQQQLGERLREILDELRHGARS